LIIRTIEPIMPGI